MAPFRGQTAVLGNEGSTLGVGVGLPEVFPGSGVTILVPGEREAVEEKTVYEAPVVTKKRINETRSRVFFRIRIYRSIMPPGGGFSKEAD